MSVNSTAWAASMMVRFGNRSDNEPATGVNTRVGRNMIAVSHPNAWASPAVSSTSTTQDWAVRVIQIPILEAVTPMK